MSGLDAGASSEILPAGTTIGSYRLLDLLGEGGMGRVYVAEHVKLGRRVAVKMLRAEFASNPVAISRFFAEARAVNRISHENIVEITDFLENHNCYIMELLKGEDLGLRLLRAEQPSLAVSIEIGAQIASALTAVHAAHIIHRDLKPDNIFLIDRGGSRNFVKLLDFGVAKLVDPSGQGVQLHTTAVGQIIGTPEYMSPEQAGGQPVDHRTDIYALGVILYELVTGQLPFTAKSFGELVIKHMTVPPKRPSTIAKQIPPELDELIMDLLAKDADDRPQSMTEVEDRLHEVYETLDIPTAVRTSASMRAMRVDSGPIRRVDSGPIRRVDSGPIRRVDSGPVRKVDSGPVRKPERPDPTGPTVDAAPEASGAIRAAEASGKLPVAEVAPDEPAPAPVPPPPRSPRAWIAGGIAVAVVAALAIGWIATRGDSVESVASIASVALATPPPSPAKPSAPPVKLRFTSVPAGATVRVAGSDRVLGTTPFVATLARADASLQVEIAKPGYEPVREEVALASDGVLATVLTAERVAAPVPAAATKPVAKRAVKKPAKPAAAKPLDRGGTMDVFGGGK